ncbi:MAG: tetratricopeptide repeat protein [Bacteroidaceae bacterium]
MKEHTHISHMGRGMRGLCLCVLVSVVSLLVSCSTKKNTSATRFYHATTARFNTLYNGQVAYKEGREAQLKGHVEDYTQLLPMYICTNKKTAEIGKGNYETAITKSEKAIKVHSIKKRPTTNANKRKTAKEKAYLARKEFNPYLYRAWFLMAEAQFRRGEFIEAASTYNYILRLYSTQPDIVCVAKARLARCYVALEWAYDAEDILGKMKRDSITRQGTIEKECTETAYRILTQQYKEAIPCLKTAIKSTHEKVERARLNFLLGQLYRETGDNTQAYKALSKVRKASPPYEMSFNASILQTEVMPKSKFGQMISRLKRMAKSDKNKNYLDQVYYAMGNIYLGVQDTSRCLSSWEKGVEEATKSGPSKAMLLLRLSQMYWEREDYINAARTYKSCVAILDKEHDEYKETDRRSKILSELEPHLSTIKLQDSLQALAKMSEPEYTAAIDRVIEALKKKEKEEEKKAARNGTNTSGNQTGNNNTAATQRAQPNTGANAAAGQKGAWYFYNPTMVKQGEQEFRKRWGQRPNEDYWRISNRQMLPGAENKEEANINEEQADSLYGAGGGENPDEEEQARKDSLANDPHHREYYLKQIPFTEEQMAESNGLLSEGLYNAGILEQERLENFPLAEKTMLRLLNDFPEQEGLDDIYYHLFLLYGRIGKPDEAELYRQRLLEEYPDSKLATLLGSPYYEMIARQGKHMEDSVYAQAYQSYTNGDYAQVEKNYQFSTENFPQGVHRARMLFIRAMASLYGGERDTFLVSLKEVVQKYPKEDITQLANAIVKGIDEGRQLMSEQYDASSIWARRTRAEGADSTDAAKQLSEERYSNFVFMLAYPTASLDEDLLLYEMAHYNFTSYMVRNFDIEITEDRGIRMMTIKGFLSYDEVHAYAQKLYADKHMSTLLKGIRSLIISEENLKLLGTEYSFDDYKEFYESHFVPMQVPEDLQIDEPTDLKIIDPDDVEEEEEQEEGSETEDADYDDFPYGS